MGARRERAPYKVRIKKTGLSNRDVHGFIEDFTDRYSLRISSGEDLRFVYDYELEAFCEGFKVFELDREYENNASLSIIVRERKEDRIIVEYEEELYEVFDFFIEEGVETLILSDIVWRADTMKTNS